MKKFSDIVKNIRDEAGLSQKDFAIELGVSTIYISKIETEQKEASKQFLIRLSDFVGVHPSTLAPYLFYDEHIDEERMTFLEKKLIEIVENLQTRVFKKKLSHDKSA